MAKKMCLLVTAVLIAGGSATWAMQEGDPVRRTVWDRIYTADQAARGDETFSANCRGCHNRPADLSGGEAHALKGTVFFDRWREDSLQSVFNKMKGYMPPAKTRLADDEYVDIIAFLLGENGFPAGSTELKSSELVSIRIEGKDGPRPLPNLALVKVVGCLTPVANNAWSLANATAPVRTRQPDSSSAEEIKSAEDSPAGMETFQLRGLDGLDNFTPEPNKGRRVQAKGVLYTTQTPNRLSVISIEVLGSACVLKAR